VLQVWAQARGRARERMDSKRARAQLPHAHHDAAALGTSDLTRGDGVLLLLPNAP